MKKPTKLLEESVTTLQGNLSLFVGIALPAVLLSIITLLFEPSPYSGTVDLMEWGMYIFISLLSGAVSLLATIALIQTAANTSLSCKEAFKMATGRFWAYFFLSIIIGAITVVGFMLLIIPGIYLTVLFFPASFLLILEKQSIVDSLKQSKALMKGKWWSVFYRLVVLFLLILGASLFLASFALAGRFVAEVISVVSYLILTPFAMIYSYKLYQEVKSPTTGFSMEGDTNMTNGTPDYSAEAEIPKSTVAGL